MSWPARDSVRALPLVVAMVVATVPCLGQAGMRLQNPRSVFPPPGFEIGFVNPPIRPFGLSGVVVRDGKDHQLYAMSATGSPVRPIGRVGEGPGEYRAIAGIWIRADTLLTTDTGLRRTSIFNVSNGKLLGTWPVGQDTKLGSGLVRPLVSFDRSCWLGTTTRATPRRGEDGSVETVEILVVVHEAGDKTSVDSVFTRTNTGLHIRPLGELSANRVPSATANPPVLAIAPDGRGFAIIEALVSGTGIVIHSAKDPCRQPVHTRTLAATPRELSRADVSAIYNTRLSPRRRTEVSLEDEIDDAVRQTARVSGRFIAPLFSAAFIDAAGRQWIEVGGGFDLPGAGSERRWLVVSEDGRPPVSVLAPAKVKLQSSNGARVQGWLPTDEGGVVMEYELQIP